jgi:transposase
LFKRILEVEMLSTADRQVGMFDAAPLCQGLVGEDSFYTLLAEHGDRIVADADFADCYSQGTGRPSIPPSLLAKVLLLQYREGLSDERAMEAVRLHLGWKVALGLPIDHGGFHPTTLVKFRARLLLHGKERLALERTLELATELGLMKGTVEQIVDSTPMLGAAATQDTVRLVRAGVAKLIAAVMATDGEAGGELSAGLEFDYAKPNEKPDCEWRSKPKREAMLSRVAEDAERALRAVGEAEGLLADETVAEAHRLLRELVGQDFDLDDDGVPRLHRGTRSGRVLSVHDTEMRHGRKSESQRFDGYKLSAMATNNAQPLITSVSVAPASEQDGPQAPGLIDSQPEARRPERILGDTAYGNGPARAELAEREVGVLAPVPTPPPTGRFAKAEFEIDHEAETLTCPAGKTARLSPPDRKGQRTAHFRLSVCRPCPLRAQCTSTEQRNVTISSHEDLLQAARLALEDEATAEHLRRTRPRVERLLGLLAHRYGARKSRYLGRRKAEMQAAWAAALVNLNPIGAALGHGTA